MRGPNPNRKQHVAMKPENTGKTIKRILEYLRPYKLQLILVMLLVIVSSAASIAGTYFLKPLFNIYIIPLIGKQNPDLSNFLEVIGLMAVIYAVGAAAAYGYNRLMLNISAGTLYRIRTDMFRHMQSLPLKYFDTHTHGELMSRLQTMLILLETCSPKFCASVLIRHHSYRCFYCHANSKPGVNGCSCRHAVSYDIRN